MKIAVCDDRKENLEELCSYIAEYFTEREDNEYQLYSCLSGKELLNVIEKKQFDIYFLDVLMPEIGGMEIGRMIREKNQEAIIVYISVSKEFAFEAFGVRAFQYLQKPVKKEELYDVFDQIMCFVKRKQDRRVGIRTREGLVNVKIDEIMYVENMSRCAVYMIKDKEPVVSVCNRGSFEKSVSFLNSHFDFVQPHKSYFVNMHYIHTFSSKSLIMEDGTQIAISRKRYEHTKKRYLEFLNNGEKS